MSDHTLGLLETPSELVDRSDQNKYFSQETMSDQTLGLPENSSNFVDECGKNICWSKKTMSGQTFGLPENHSELVDKRDKNECYIQETELKDETVHLNNKTNESKQTANFASEYLVPLNGNLSGSVEVKTVIAEAEYIESENLTDFDDVKTCMDSLLERLDSKDWIMVCESLNDVRRMSIFHKEDMLEILNKVVSLVVKSMKSPRSAVCKTAIMTSAEIFSVYSDQIVDLFDPLLVQLLLKSAQDKRFVCEAAERALLTMTKYVSPSVLLDKLQPYLRHKNPRIRAKAAMCFSRSVPQLGTEGINAYGMDKLILVAAAQLRDQLPDSREAARSLALELKTVYENSNILPPQESELSEVHSWADFCQAKLSPLDAQAILRVNSVVKEGPAVGC